MAKTKTATKRPTGGPYLTAAVFCDRILQGDDGAMTAVRMVDHITIGISADAPPDVPSPEKQLLTDIEGLISFKKGYSGTKHRLKLAMTSPSGKRMDMVKRDVHFRDETHGGYNLRLKMKVAVGEAGLHWMDVILDGKAMTRVPLLISVQRVEPDAAPPDQKKKAAKARK
jgi:hypothetical protein